MPDDLETGTKSTGQATAIEQSRAIAQVQGALVVARQNPRDTIAATERMREACSHMALAEHAFFRFSRGGSQINGPTIHLATELSRCWGNIDYGITELSRNMTRGESEMLAHAWDQETNTRIVNSFIVPHSRDTRRGRTALTDVRDIYENNANMGARRLRECIFRVLPVSYREEAMEICAHTLEHGGGVPIETRREKMLEAFAAKGVTRKQIEKKAGRKADKLSGHDLGMLGIAYRSINRGETSIAHEFPDDRAAEMTKKILALETPPVPAPQEIVQQEKVQALPETNPVLDLPDADKALIMRLQAAANHKHSCEELDDWYDKEAISAMEVAGLVETGRLAVLEHKKRRWDILHQANRK